MARQPSIFDLIRAAIEAEATALDQIEAAQRGLLRHLTSQIEDWYDPAQVSIFTQAAGKADQSARKQSAAIADAYLRYTFDLLDVQSEGRPEPIPDPPRGIPLEEEWVRPVKEYRRARLKGLDEFQAAEAALARAERIAETDIRVAARDAHANRLAVAPGIVGWRRVIHPELSRGGTCGLCIAAADRPYRTSELAPLHNRCKCTVAPITEALDPGSPINNAGLKALYEAAGSTGRQDLARVRLLVEQHGELGPVLVDARHNFRGPIEVSRDSEQLRESARSELAALEASLRDLETREAAGEDVAGPIAWQRDRITALRELAGAA